MTRCSNKLATVRNAVGANQSILSKVWKSHSLKMHLIATRPPRSHIGRTRRGNGYGIPHDINKTWNPCRGWCFEMRHTKLRALPGSQRFDVEMRPDGNPSELHHEQLNFDTSMIYYPTIIRSKVSSVSYSTGGASRRQPGTVCKLLLFKLSTRSKIRTNARIIARAPSGYEAFGSHSAIVEGIGTQNGYMRGLDRCGFHDNDAGLHFEGGSKLSFPFLVEAARKRKAKQRRGRGSGS
ncbi:hypothetical protein BDP55DRAFT_85901 [Colletotrichum godetiae]|uniref:Uncharacterized protein n=1 Tax=Colletotrichum godetiae TaxID=1209918 RepID=A0AAJ0EUL1_9PEZI|nr:uncharacterized protein BDP55DRAFT_85901 [Colletotrichum godetiae]KAK1687759.1 hypothetical protein BDP55DRAFT_85901 [Colletotrichum godetiae]